MAGSHRSTEAVTPLSLRLRSRAFLQTSSDDGEIATSLLGSSVTPPLAQMWERERTRRERAERQRLFYVAITRAEKGIVFIGDRAVSKSEDTLCHDVARRVLLPLAESGTLPFRYVAASEPMLPGSTVRTRDHGGEAEQRGSAVALAIAAEQPVPERTDSGTAALAPVFAKPPSLILAPTALADYAHCPRRFALTHILDVREDRPEFARSRSMGLETPAVAIDVRLEGTAMHRVLERVPLEMWGAEAPVAAVMDLLQREGVAVERAPVVALRIVGFLCSAYARKVRSEHATLERETAFSIAVPLPAGGTLLLRGTIDLLVRWSDGSSDVIDYKRSRGPEVSQHAFQLNVYRLACAQRYPGKVRAGLVFLGGAPEPVFLEDEPEPAALTEEIGKLAQDMLAARACDVFPRVTLPSCRALHCGYVARCHGDT